MNKQYIGYGVVWAAAMMCSAGMLAGQPVVKAPVLKAPTVFKEHKVLQELKVL